MILVPTRKFLDDAGGLQERTKKLLKKSLDLLLSDHRHPSLQSKKLPGTDYWYARIDRAHRFTYQIDGETITLRRVGTHAILAQERD